MKLNLVFTFLSILIFAAIFSSCGDDTTTNPGTPSGTVLYSKDSIAVWISSGTSFNSDSVAFKTSESGGNGVKVEFTIQSNADSLHAIGYYNFYSNATPPVPILPYIYFPFDQPFSTNLNFSTSGSTYFGLVVKLNTNGAATPYYVKLKNIKITKL